MKTNDIIKILKENKKIADYELTVTEKKSRELFYVLKNLEINRATEITKNRITVYVDKKDKRGSTTIMITSSDDEKSVVKKVNDAVVKASQALNPYFPLQNKTVNIKEKCEFKEDLNEVALKIGNAVFKADVYKEGWINSTEIFVSKYTKHFINSKGINHSYEFLRCEVEVIPTWSNGKEEFELYKFFESAKPDYKLVTKEVEEILELAKNRSIAKKIDEVKLPKNLKVLIQGDMLNNLVWNFASELSYRANYYKVNHYQLKDEISGVPFDITLKGVDKKCSNSCPFDQNGVVLENKKIIKSGKAVSLWGDMQHAHYLDNAATGKYSILDLKGTELDYETDKHLIISNFSSPQLDENSGYWGGEVRLALYFDGKKYIPVSNFSISGNIFEDVKKMHVSKEKAAQPDYTGPRYLIFEGLNIF